VLALRRELGGTANGCLLKTDIGKCAGVFTVSLSRPYTYVGDAAGFDLGLLRVVNMRHPT